MTIPSSSSKRQTPKRSSPFELIPVIKPKLSRRMRTVKRRIILAKRNMQDYPMQLRF
jgi:hypothetical protein